MNDYVSQKQQEKQMILDKIESLRESVQAQVHSGQINICAALDVIDKRFLGNAESILLNQNGGIVPQNGISPVIDDHAAPSGAQEQMINGQQMQSLLIIGETPNPDDEETHRAEFSKRSPEYFGKRVSPILLKGKYKQKPAEIQLKSAS